MDNITLQPNTASLTVTPTNVEITTAPQTVDVIAQPNEVNLNLQPNELAVTLQPLELNLAVQTGNVNYNYYTSGGKLTVDFAYSDFGSANKLIGEITSGRVIINTVIEINAAFDAGSFTVGTNTAQAVLMTIADRANAIGRYMVNNYIELSTTDNYKIFFSGSPTQGSGKVFITFA